ncbi:MAG: long-chain fatty acid--CoA ligase [Polyangiaceae bacterium]
MTARFSTLAELCEKSCLAFAERPLFGTKERGGWTWTRYGEFRGIVADCRAGLAAMGVGPDDKVALVSNNRVEWAACAYAAYGLGATVVPMYEAQLPSEWEFILGDCGAKIVFAANPAIAARLAAVASHLPSLQHILHFDGSDKDPDSFAALRERGHGKPVALREPAPDVTANLIYTSGTMGKPKGVMLSHGNIVSNVNALHDVFPFDPDDRSLSFLPWAHAFGQAELHTFLSMGCALALNRDVRQLLDEIAEVKPTVLVAVPRIFERLYAAVWEQLRDRPEFVQSLVRSAVRWSTRLAHGERLGVLESLGLRVADALVFSKVRARFGGRLKYVICGGAALEPEVGHFIDAMGLTVYEGYGLTETSPIVSANSRGHRRLGSAGRILPGVRVVIDRAAGEGADGEIVVYGPNVMKGYHNRPDESSTLLPDGGFRTGDLGHLDADGYLFITGRLKEQFKLQNGKYVMPAPLEDSLKISPYIANVVIYGDNRPYCVALVLIDIVHVHRWAKEKGIELHDPTNDERVIALVRQEIEERSLEFKRFEKPRAFALAIDEFTPENGMMTPTLKLKRRLVLGKYKALLDALYAKSKSDDAA